LLVGKEDKGGCVFPFTFAGKSFSGCDNLDEDYPMCSYTPDFNGVWKYCGDQKSSPSQCSTPCDKGDEEWPSCRANGKKQYCTDKIKYLETSDTDPFGKLSFRPVECTVA
jgi:hypothetical protein